jgi:hypothetical protein
MPANSELRQSIVDLVDEVLQERLVVGQQQGSESGTVAKMNDDGTVLVYTAAGVLISCGTPRVRAQGESVVVVTADSLHIAL